MRLGKNVIVINYLFPFLYKDKKFKVFLKVLPFKCYIRNSCCILESLNCDSNDMTHV